MGFPAIVNTLQFAKKMMTTRNFSAIPSHTGASRLRFQKFGSVRQAGQRAQNAPAWLNFSGKSRRACSAKFFRTALYSIAFALSLRNANSSALFAGCFSSPRQAYLRSKSVALALVSGLFLLQPEGFTLPPWRDDRVCRTPRSFSSTACSSPRHRWPGAGYPNGFA